MSPVKSYCAIIGDINSSRSLPQRARIQRDFQKAIQAINAEFKKEIASKFILTLGDEFQGLLFTPGKSYELVQRFQDLMDKTPFAFGVGVGPLSTPLIQKEALGMDGEAFHRARNALTEAKRTKHSLCYSLNSDSEILVNALIGLMDKLWLKLTTRQKKIVGLLKMHPPKEVARRLRISTQAVSKTKKTASFVELNAAVEALNRFLSMHEKP